MESHPLCGLLVAPAGQPPDPGLRHILDRRVAADGVTVDGAVADGELTLVAAGQHDRGWMLVGLGHPDHSADPGLQVFGGDAVEIEHLVESVDGRGDRHGLKCKPVRAASSAASLLECSEE